MHDLRGLSLLGALLLLSGASWLSACAGSEPVTRPRSDGGDVANLGVDDSGPVARDFGPPRDATFDAFIDPDASSVGLECAVCTTDADCGGRA